MASIAAAEDEIRESRRSGSPLPCTRRTTANTVARHKPTAAPTANRQRGGASRANRRTFSPTAATSSENSPAELLI
jgi:hypothetical protein